MTELRARLYGWVFRDECPCENCGGFWDVKARTLAVALSVPLATTGLAHAAFAGGEASMTVITVGVAWWLAVVGPLVEEVNDRMPEWCPKTGMLVKTNE